MAKKKRKSDNQIIDEVIAQSTPAPKLDTLPEEVIDEIVAAPVIKVQKEKPAPKVAAKAPGMYHNGRRIERVLSRLGRTWVVSIDGRREKVLQSEIETIK